MKIGIVTLHNYNFGSALQCYATQHLLESRGYECEVVDLSIGVGLFKGRLMLIWSLLMLCLKSPKDYKKILKMFTAQRGKSISISKASLHELQRFNNSLLYRRTYSSSFLKRIAKTDDFGLFLSGSDQVWNGSRINEYDKYFLRFSPSKKKVAWAASFGEGEVAKYNIKRYKKYIKDYRYISVREKTGVSLVKNLTGRDAVLLADPVMMLDADQWRAIKGLNHNEPYILAFFIDNPSENALSRIRELRETSGLDVVTFGYEHAEMEGAIHRDGGPFDFVSMIDKAEYVLTDSFHAIAFASLLHKRFFIFERMYVHGQSQSTRVIDFLSSVNLTSRYEPANMEEKEPDFSAADNYFENKRILGEEFLNNILRDIHPSDHYHKMVRKEKYNCCGCGACVGICAHHAITMQKDEEGNVYPYINKELCVECGLCSKICAFGAWRSSDYLQHSYVGALTEPVLRSQSASGGIFVALAQHVIEEGGVVFGSSLWMENGKVHCEHISVEDIDNLWRIQGSKYVHSATDTVFPCVKEELQKGRQVLFGGTSCQVAALKAFLRKDYENLLTTDLVCHGVPDLQQLQDYIDYLSGKYNEEIIDFKFRVRSKEGDPYKMTMVFKSGKTKQIGMRESSYYRLFMSCAGYRPSCYNCPFATMNKPGDITLADYYLQDRSKLDKGLYEPKMLSSFIVNTDKGQKAIDNLDKRIVKQGITLLTMKESHEQLQHPSAPNLFGDALYTTYRECGFKELQIELNGRNFITGIGAKVKRMFHNY